MSMPFLNVKPPVNLPYQGTVQIPAPGTHPSITGKLGPLPTTILKPVASVKVPSFILKPRTQQEAAAGGRTLELSTGTIVVALLAVGVVGYVLLSKKKV